MSGGLEWEGRLECIPTLEEAAMETCEEVRSIFGWEEIAVWYSVVVDCVYKIGTRKCLLAQAFRDLVFMGKLT